MKTQNGFTLIEVLLAMAILTGAVLIVTNLEIRSFFKIVRDRDDIEKIFLLKKTMFNVFLKPQTDKFKQKDLQKIEKPEMTVTTVLEDVNQKSSLKDLRDRLKAVKVQGTWKLDNAPKDMLLLTFILRPIEEQEGKRS